MAMRPKKVEKTEPPFFADSPIVSPGKRTRATESRLNRSPASPAASPASVARAKVNSGSVRSPGGFLGTRAKAKAKSEREKLIAQEVRRSSVIQRDESIGMELMDAPTKRTSRSGEDDDFFAEMDHADGTILSPGAGHVVSYGYSGYGKGGVSSASETPTFAQSPTEDEMVREPMSTGSRVSRVSRSQPQTSMFSSDEESSPRMMPREAPKLPPKSAQITKRTSASFLSESEDSPVDARRRFPAKLQEAPRQTGPSGHVGQSEPLRRPLFQEDVSRATQSLGTKFPPEDVTLTFEPLVLEEEKEPQVAPESESDANLSQDMDELPQVIIPEDLGSPQAGREDRDSRPRSKSEVEPLPVLKVTPSPDLFTSPAFSPDAKGRSKDLSSTSASTCTPSGESRFMASPSAASELSRSPWNEDQSALKQQLEELEEQQKQIQSGLKEALQHHRRLWADELQRCQETSKELEKALEDERRQHAEQIKEWESRLQSELTKKESQWREEVDALVKEVDRLRQRCREHLQRKPPEPKSTSTVGTSCDDQDVAVMMDLLSQQLQPKVPQQDLTISLSATTSTKVEKPETPKQVRISEVAEVSTEADLTLPIGAAREARLEASSLAASMASSAPVSAPYQALGAVSELWTTAKASSQLEASETLPAPRPRQALSAFSSPGRERKSASSSPVGLEFPSPVLVPQDGTPSNSPLKRIKPKVTSFLDATPIGPPLPSFTPSVWTPEELNARAYSRSPRGLAPESPWTPTLHLSVERSPNVARFSSAQVPTEPLAQACGSPSANADYLRFGPNAHFEAPKGWRRDGFEPSLM